MTIKNNNIKNKKGLALILALLFLVILSLLALVSVNQSGFIQSVSYSSEGKNVAFHAAEIVVYKVQHHIATHKIKLSNQGYYYYNKVNIDKINWLKSSKVLSYSLSSYSSPVNKVKARYIVQKMPFSRNLGTTLSSDSSNIGLNLYRTTVYTQGPYGHSHVIIQTIYNKGRNQ